ncbi:MAG: IMP cyclohydrolase [Chloroflexi bacterium]|nr:IMP cyclohydrolase [Chloroflexota bacterium]
MYIGRFVIVGRTASGAWYAGYRVSSRSFPNRRIVLAADRAMVLPTKDAPPSDNPYIAYNCLRRADDVLVVANGSQVDPIIEKVQAGYGLRDALTLPLLALDYEHDQLNTPRVVAALDATRNEGWLGIVAEERLTVQRVALAPGEAQLIATYERTAPTPIALAGETPEALAEAIYACEYERPVAALAAMLADGALQMAAHPAG